MSRVFSVFWRAFPIAIMTFRTKRSRPMRLIGEPENSARGMAELAKWYAEGKIKPAIDRRLPMRELPAAYEHMATRKVQGKVVLVND